MKRARLVDLGTKPYREVWDLQHSLHERIRRGEEIETWIFVEHPPVITLGRNAKESSLRLSRSELAARGIDVASIERGGDVTYHGPGQLVVYPIRRLERFREVVPLVRALEGAVIETCAYFGVQSERWTEHAGVWCGNEQICAIGLAVRRMTSLHGIALNVSTELSYDRLIVPCGLDDRGITSLSRRSGRPLAVAEVKPVLQAALESAFDMAFDREELWQSKSA